MNDKTAIRHPPTATPVLHLPKPQNVKIWTW